MPGTSTFISRPRPGSQTNSSAVSCIATSATCRLCRRQHAQRQAGRVIRRTQNAMRGLLEVFGFGEVNIWNKRLRIAVDEGKPSALNLHHQSVPFREAMQDVEQF